MEGAIRPEVPPPPARTSLGAHAGASAGNALPRDWEALWGQPADPAPLAWHRIQRDTGSLARDIELIDRSALFAPLVGSQQLRDAPVHRWFAYKEGYSPGLLSAVINTLGLVGPLTVADTFGGVATTALAGRIHPQVTEVRGLEYSPWARFVGRTKLSWPDLDPVRLRRHLASAVDYRPDFSLAFPDLSTFRNPKMFHPRTVTALLSARQHLRGLPGMRPAERDFFLLGLGAVVEDLSYAMKDGRALRIRGDRRRRPSSLADHPAPLATAGRVKRALAGQWTAMIEDLEALAPIRRAAARTPVHHLAGDAREPHRAQLDDGQPAFPSGWADLSCFSPPYLNCIDYTELYKLELWLLEHVCSQAQFRETRLGTLRSHPSVAFPARDSFAGLTDTPVVKTVTDISEWVTQHGARREVGPVLRNYFEDMLEVWRGQRDLLKPDGVAACVVANSTFSRRDPRDGGGQVERWRLPVVTDVILAHLATLAGFSRTEIWHARALRPRNVRGGSARESLVIAFR
jgi:hypothetical protein